MRKYLFLILSCFVLVNSWAQKGQPITYEISLGSEKDPGRVRDIWPDNKPPTSEDEERYTDLGLSLVNSTTPFSGMALDDLEIDLTKGVEIEFTYLFSDNGAKKASSTGGLVMFLYDSAVKNDQFKLGADADALGYTFYQSSADASSSSTKTALTGGYFALAIDNTDKFKAPNSDISKAFVQREGIRWGNYVDGLVDKPATGSYSSRVLNSDYKPDSDQLVFRGAVQPTQNKLLHGNPVIYSRYVGGLIPQATQYSKVEFIYDEQQYLFSKLTENDLVDIAKVYLITDEDVYYPTLTVTMLPNKDASALIISVDAKLRQEEDGVLKEVVRNIVDKFEYRTAFVAEDATYGENGKKYNYNAPIPTSVKLGFVALGNTGPAVVRAVRTLKNIKVTHNKLFGVDVFTDVLCIENGDNLAGKAVSMSPFEGYQVQSDSFRFLDADYNELEGNTLNSPHGTWSYDQKTAEVKLVLDKDLPEGTTEEIRYVITSRKGEKSVPSSVKVTTGSCIAVLANPNIPVTVGEQ